MGACISRNEVRAAADPTLTAVPASTNKVAQVDSSPSADGGKARSRSRPVVPPISTDALFASPDIVAESDDAVTATDDAAHAATADVAAASDGDRVRSDFSLSDSDTHDPDSSSHTAPDVAADASSGDESDDSDDDTASLTEEQARAIAEATAAISIVHSVAQKRVRSILSTGHTRGGVLRPLHNAFGSLRRKGVRWHSTEATWSERVVAFNAPPTTPRHVHPTPSTTGKGADAFSKSSDSTPGGKARKNAGEKWIGHRTRSNDSSSSTDAAESTHATVEPVASSSTHNGPIAAFALQLPSATTSASSASASSSSSAVVALTSSTRQYTSSARIAGSNSFKARQAQSTDNSPHSSNMSLSSVGGVGGGGTGSLNSGVGLGLGISHALSANSNVLLKLSPSQIANLKGSGLQQLFMLYGKSARNARDRAYARKPSPLFNYSNPPLTPAQSLLLAAGVQDACPASALTPGAWAQSAAWTELDSLCSMSSEEQQVLSLHLVQRKLSLELATLAQRDEVRKGTVKITALLAQARWALFPGALGQGLPSPHSDTRSISQRAPHTDARDGPSSSPRSADAPASGTAPSAHPSATPSPPALAAPVLKYPVSSLPLPLPPPPLGLSEVEITDMFVRCTSALLSSRLRLNNFGELVWGGWCRPAAAHQPHRSGTAAVAAAAAVDPESSSSDAWHAFVTFFFAYHAAENPEGLDERVLTEARKQERRGGKAATSALCAIQ